MRTTIWLALPILVLLLISCKETAITSPESNRRALIIVDMQNDFLPGGSLPTAGGDQIVNLINRLQGEFDLVVATQDWHPQNHGSFASNQPGHRPGEVVKLHGLDQVLWPDHAVQGSAGAELVADLNKRAIERVFQKGMDPKVDSYSGFFDNGQRGDTGLDAYLRSQDVSEVYVVGLALDYCVKYTAMDARQQGFDTTLIVDATRAVNLQPQDGKAAVDAMKLAGIQIVRAESLFN